jgi:hypothetical protein
MITDYVHQPLNREITAIGGSYTLIREVRLPMGGGEVLYLLGYGIFDSTCCGAGGCGYALVQGWVRQWHYRSSPNGELVTGVVRIRGDADCRRVESLIKKKELVPQVVFL